MTNAYDAMIAACANAAPALTDAQVIRLRQLWQTTASPTQTIRPARRTRRPPARSHAEEAA